MKIFDFKIPLVILTVAGGIFFFPHALKAQDELNESSPLQLDLPDIGPFISSNIEDPKPILTPNQEKPMSIQELLLDQLLLRSPQYDYQKGAPMPTLSGAIGTITVPSAYINNGLYALFLPKTSFPSFDYYLHNTANKYPLLGAIVGANYSFLDRVEIFLKMSFGLFIQNEYFEKPSQTYFPIFGYSVGSKFNILDTDYISLALMFNYSAINLYYKDQFVTENLVHLFQPLFLTTINLKYALFSLALGKTFQFQTDYYTQPLNIVDVGVGLELPFYVSPNFYFGFVGEFTTYMTDSLMSITQIRVKDNYYFHTALRFSFYKKIIGLDLGALNISTKTTDTLDIFVKFSFHFDL